MKFKIFLVLLLLAKWGNAMEVEAEPAKSKSKAEKITLKTDLILAQLADGFNYVKNEDQAQELVKQIKYKLCYPTPIMVEINRDYSPAIIRLLEYLGKNKKKVPYKDCYLSALRAFVELGQQIDEYDALNKYTPLHRVKRMLISKDIEDKRELFALFDLLIEKGASMNKKAKGFKAGVIEVIYDLFYLYDVGIEAGNKPKEIRNKCLSNGLIVMDKLIKAGADVNIQESKQGNTPVHITIQSFNRHDTDRNEFAFEITKHLVKNGADITIANKNGKTPFGKLMSDTIVQLGWRINDFCIEDLKKLINFFMANKVDADVFLLDLFKSPNALKKDLNEKNYYDNPQKKEVQSAGNRLEIIKTMLTHKIEITTDHLDEFEKWMNRLKNFCPLKTHSDRGRAFYNNKENRIEDVEAQLVALKEKSAACYEILKKKFERQMFFLNITQDDIVMGKDITTMCHAIKIKKGKVDCSPVLETRIAHHNELQSFIAYVTQT